MRGNFEKLNGEIFPICIGTGDYFWNADCSEKHKISLIEQGLERGVNLLDTAAEYGDGISETLVGQAIRGKHDRTLICTKVSPENLGLSALITSAEHSLLRLGVDCIDIFTIHWPNPAILIEETLDALCELLDQKKINSVGLSNFGQMQINQFRERLGDKLSTLQMEFNIHERLVEENGLLDYCRQNNLILMGYSPLDQGRLHDVSDGQGKTLIELEKKYGAARSQIVLSYLIAKQPVIPIIRTTSASHLAENIEAASIVLGADDIAGLDQAFPAAYELIDTDNIEVSPDGEWGHGVYYTYEAALENKLNFVPSPADLAGDIKHGEFLKPIRLRKLAVPNGNKAYELIGGRIRFWAWQIAHGNNNTQIPAYVRDN